MKISKSMLVAGVSASSILLTPLCSAVQEYGIDYAYYYEDNGRVAWKQYSDDHVFDAGNANKIITPTNMAIDISKNYTDNISAADRQYTDKKMSDLLTETNDYAQQQATTAEKNANSYTDSKTKTVNNRADHLDSKIDDNRKRASAGIAGAMAMSAIPHNFGYDSNFGMGMANYDSEQAISAGGYYRINDMTTVSLKASYDTKNNIGAATGVSVGW
ncbi:YadA-like family protein [Escherichia coli]|uniref:YadA C-terminal domain-containing protein n=1 Tax=Escherichia coli TaxID=562 RepID=UPI00184B140D|nr:YadA C-terminal domain-containing protein [Escherichia coli]EFH3744926.1 hypothetical protein [Escherichia coli]EHD5842931.1 hypothetical protein [Escherichia coli]EID6773260.1 YadA-like family protein [Escherichia coli]EKO0566014.1 YadA-like family protein [Escherichia coli]EKP8508241.1 YadA-like family protein [Escherichia coli]